MRTPKATRRKNGHMMMTKKVDFHIGLYDIAVGLADHAACCLDSAEALRRVNRSAAFTMAVEWLVHHGNWATFDDALDLMDPAMERARELFPELD